MRRILTVTLAAAAAVPFGLLASAPASAEPGDVTAVFTTTPNPGGSNTVTGTFTTTGSASECTMVDYNRNADFGFDLYAQASADPSSTSITVTDTDVPDGTYTIDWSCDLDSGDYGTTYYPFGTREPTTLVVPRVVPEEPEAPGCTGSVCLPTGSFLGL